MAVMNLSVSPVMIPLFWWRPGLLLFMMSVGALCCFWEFVSNRYQNSERALWRFYLR